MSNPQSAPELSTRGVLLQIDRRLSLIEADVRENNTKIDSVVAEIRREFSGKFNLVIGLIITTWLSVMCTLLFKL